MDDSNNKIKTNDIFVNRETNSYYLVFASIKDTYYVLTVNFSTLDKNNLPELNIDTVSKEYLLQNERLNSLLSGIDMSDFRYNINQVLGTITNAWLLDDENEDMEL